MPTFYSPEGNAEVWEEKPEGYLIVDEWLEAQPTPEPIQPTDKYLFAVLRTERDARLAATDKYLLADYPVDADNLALIKAYRAALRALPDQPGAPWDGGGEATPWPVMPEM